MAQREDDIRPETVTDRDLPANYSDPATGGTLAAEEVEGGSVIRREGRTARDPITAPDSIGNEVPLAPEFAGTVAGNTTGAAEILGHDLQDREPADVTEDLGPEGTVVQEVGGEARY